MVKVSLLLMANPDIPASPLLNCDVLLSVAEKLLFSPDNDFRLDLRDPNAAVTNFMFAGPACRWALFTQFRRLAKLSVNLTEIHLSCPTPIQGVCGLLANNKEFFQGPFVVSDNFFFKLFCKGVLRPKIVDSFFKFGLKGSSSTGSMTNNAGSADEKNSLRALRKDDVLTNESPAESLVRLFFFKNSPKFLDKLPNDSFAHCHLELQHVKIQDDTAIFRQLGRILNLNSQNYLLEISSEIDNCVSKFARPSITANRTRTVQLSYIIDIIDPEEAILVQLPVHKFYSLLRYVADCCPNLEKMSVNFLLQGEFSDEDFKVLSDWLVDTVEGFRTGELSMMGFTFDLNVSFRAFFPESTLVEASKKNHKLANMGESIHLEEGLDDIDLPDTFIIARRMQMRKQPLLCVTYSLIGIEDESSNNDWDGFHGAIMPVLQPMVVPVLPMAPFVLAVGSDDSD